MSGESGSEFLFFDTLGEDCSSPLRFFSLRADFDFSADTGVASVDTGFLSPVPSGALPAPSFFPFSFRPVVD
jgi:hypothetical protein